MFAGFEAVPTTALAQALLPLQARRGFIDVWLMDDGLRAPAAAARRLLEAHHSACLKATVLPAYVGCGHRDIVHLRAGSGKPRLAPLVAGGRDFNLSHSGGVTVMAVSDAGEVGIDIERRCRNPSARLLKWLFRPADEARYAANLAHYQANFVHAWTLNEAFAKTRGGGLRRRSIAGALMRLQEQQGPGDGGPNRNGCFTTRKWRCWQFSNEQFVLTIMLRRKGEHDQEIALGTYVLSGVADPLD